MVPATLTLNLLAAEVKLVSKSNTLSSAQHKNLNLQTQGLKLKEGCEKYIDKISI
jgi:hypothetical protein